MTVTIAGDRQTGKTELLLALAEKCIRHGKNVLYVSQDMNYATHLMRSIDGDHFGDDDFKTHRAHGNERIEHSSGGTLFFSSPRSNRWRGQAIDTLILDDGVEHDHPGAKFVYRAELAP
jgi:molybdopterin-guanine dinucleotide biosynthesis protein